MSSYVILFKNETISFANLLRPNTDGNLIWGTTWFLIALFFSNAIYYWIDRINNVVIKTVLVIIVSVFAQLITLLRTDIKMPLCLEPALVGIGLMYLGSIVKKHDENITKLKLWQWVILVLAALIFSYFSGYVNMRCEIYPNIVLFWVTAYLNIITIANISRFITEVSMLNKCKEYIKFIGENSIVYLVFNGIIIAALKIAGTFIKLESGLIYQIIILLLTMLIQYILCLVFNKTKLKVLIGRF